MALKLILDNSGYLTLESLRKACVDADCNLTETELKEMIQEVRFVS